jgi:pseudaminic acid synthase
LIEINSRRIGPGHPTYIVAEMSANHNQDYEQAVKILRAAKDAGADAVKLQTYTPDTLTIDCGNPCFHIKDTIWRGRTLHDLYADAYMPWDWQPKLKKVADDLEIDLFSTPFDGTAVEFLEGMGVPALKIASFEVVDLPLLRRVAQTGKPIIMSTGMATLGEIEEAVRTIRESGGNQLALLKCTSAYPASPSEMNLRTIPHLAAAFGVPVGLSDHTLGVAVAVSAVALGACILEKHVTLSGSPPGPDSAFSVTPDELRVLVEAVRITEESVGTVHYGLSPQEVQTQGFRRSLFVTEDIRAGEPFTHGNVRSIRPGDGLHPRHLEDVIGRLASRDIERGVPLNWSLVRFDS